MSVDYLVAFVLFPFLSLAEEEIYGYTHAGGATVRDDSWDPGWYHYYWPTPWWKKSPSECCGAWWEDSSWGAKRGECKYVGVYCRCNKFCKGAWALENCPKTCFNNCGRGNNIFRSVRDYLLLSRF